MGSKDSASPHASFILTRKHFFIVSFTSIYILLSRYSNNRNLNLCLLNKYLLDGLVFKIFKIAKRVFLPCFYVRYNRVFPTGESPPTSQKFAHPPTRKSPLVNFLLTRFSSPPPPSLNGNFISTTK